MEKINKKTILYYAAILIVLIFGFYFRLQTFLQIRPMWLDECFLFFNAFERSYTEFFSELYFAQSAPPIFLIVEKFFIALFGIKETSVRFLPYLCSIISLPVFFLFSKIYLKKKTSIVVANILFAINIHLIFYAQELKQYSCDVLFLMLTILFLRKISFNKTKAIIKYIIISVIFPLISLICYLPIAGFLLSELFKNKLKNLKSFILIQVPLLCMSLFYYTTTLLPQKKLILIYSSDLWKQGYLGFNLFENCTVIKNLYVYFFYPNKIAILLITLSAIGFTILAKNYKIKRNFILLFVFLVSFLCAFLKIYPLYERASLFLIPVFIILITKPIDTITCKRKICSILVILLFIFSFHNYNLQYLKQLNTGKIWNARFKGEMSNAKEIVKTLIQDYHPNDILIINNASKTEWYYYKKYYNFKPLVEYYTEEDEYTKEEYQDFINKILVQSEMFKFICTMDYSPDLKVLSTYKNLKSTYPNIKEYKAGMSYMIYVKR